MPNERTVLDYAAHLQRKRLRLRWNAAAVTRRGLLFVGAVWVCVALEWLVNGIRTYPHGILVARIECVLASAAVMIGVLAFFVHDTSRTHRLVAALTILARVLAVAWTFTGRIIVN